MYTGLFSLKSKKTIMKYNLNYDERIYSFF